MPPKPETKSDAAKTDPPAKPANAPAENDQNPPADPDDRYKERFNTTAIRLKRQLVALRKLATASTAVPKDETREKALVWLEREFSQTVAALRGVKVATSAEGPL